MTAPHQPARRRLGDNVHIVYIDDSTPKKEQSEFQLIGAVIVNDAIFDELEQHLAYYLYELVYVDANKKFEEFHASDVLACRGPFVDIKRARALEILSNAIAAVNKFKIPVVYGAVDLVKHRIANCGSAMPIDYAFRGCVKLVEKWFKENSPDGLGLLISDDYENKKIKEAMQNSFNLFRNRAISSPMVRGILEHLHDDMYFGASKYSKGIQLADICTLLIGRHLVGYADTDDLYQQLSPSIVKFSLDEPL